MASPPTIAILSAHRHPRLRFVLQEMKRDLGWHFRLVTDPAVWASLAAAGKMTYGVLADHATHLAIPAHPFLSGGTPTDEDLTTVEYSGLPHFFAVGEAFDLLAMIFYSLSRYEEYLDFVPDRHQRFPARASHAFQHGYLDRPVVREWTAKIAESLRQVFPDLPPPKQRPFQFCPSYDIDLLWAWQHRGLRGYAAGLKDLLTGKLNRAWQRFTTAPADDPYDTIDFLESLHQQYQLNPIWFWLVADRTHREDPNPYPIPANQQTRIQQLAAVHTYGVHPSYASSKKTALIRSEADRLAKIVGSSIQRSRQHFLRFQLPETFRALRLAGIAHEYSMGYASAIGWRAGTNLPFHWYDVEKEQATSLLLHPFAAMDATLKSYLKLGPEAAKKQVLKLAQKTVPFGGEFMLLWHNSSFAPAYGWSGWEAMYGELVEELVRMH